MSLGDPLPTSSFSVIAERFRRAGQPDRAVALCREGLARFPDHLSARVTLGWALLDLGLDRDAFIELQAVLRRAPDNLAAIRGLAELHARGGEMDDADVPPGVEPEAIDEGLPVVIAAPARLDELAAEPAADVPSSALDAEAIDLDFDPVLPALARTKQTEPVEHVAPVEFVGPNEYVEPVEFVEPIEYVGPIGHVGPIQQAEEVVAEQDLSVLALPGEPFAVDETQAASLTFEPAFDVTEDPDTLVLEEIVLAEPMSGAARMPAEGHELPPPVPFDAADEGVVRLDAWLRRVRATRDKRLSELAAG